MKKLVRYRNLISHEYYNISPDDVKKLLRKIHTIDDFLNEAKKALS
ncbi:TPA: DUF86 domain-containing protein [Candidatus Micrarchaeota archaeon]|nr:DUF86 domain-containing protein [Candidatus Micrarchaeota archaeon]